MYFKYEAEIKEINFPAVADFNFDGRRFIPGDINFGSCYSLIFLLERYKIVVLLHVDNQTIKEGLVICDIYLPIELKFFYCIFAFPVSSVIPELSINIKKELHDYLIKTIDMLMWRFNLIGSHNYLIKDEFQSSIDSENWHKVRISQGVTVYLPPLKFMNYRNLLNTSGLIQDKDPLEYELFREADNNLKDNPRSSLIMAIAAAETGFKRLASELHPQNEWLLETGPSPHLITMLKNYLPLLPVVLDINGDILIPRHIRRVLDSANDKRNKLAHTGSFQVDEEELREILIAVRDLLYLLDYYRGYEWALSNLSIKTSKSLGLSKTL